MVKVDLHIHSNHSDGSNSIEELAKIIIEKDINIFALTDHDTIEGCIEMSKLINSQTTTFIPAIELTCKADDIKCHILGYGCNPNNKQLQNLISKGKELRKQKLETRIQFLEKTWNIILTKDEKDWLYSRKSVVKTHLANILVKRGLATDNVSAMKKYLDNCKTGNTRFDGIEAINTIISAGGIPVWAHPLGGEGEIHIPEKEFLPKLEKMINFGIQGLECYYSRYNFEEIEILTRNAEKFNLYITGGSDYHGTNKNIPLLRLNTTEQPIPAEKITILQAL